MDVQFALDTVKKSINLMHIAHARRILREIRSVANSRFVVGLAQNTINDLNHGDFGSALRDTKTAQIVDQREDYSVQM